MGLKAFFKSNADYGADELNNIVKYLRTDGVYGEIADCLKVSKGTGTVVNIADGIGWVDGCGIEVSEGYSVTLPTAADTYYIYMAVTTAGDHTTAADITYTTEEPENKNCILASAVVSSGAITTVTDKRVYSQFRGTTQILSVYPEWVAGDYLISSDTTETNRLTNDVYTEIVKYKAGNTGTVKMSVTYAPYFVNTAGYWQLDTSKTATIRAKVGGVVQGSEMTAVGAVDTDTVTLSVTAGDVISIEGKSTRTPNGYVRITNVSFGISRISDTVTKL